MGGMTNRERMQVGLAPYGKDGKKLLLHQIGPADGPSSEVLASAHQSNYSVLHEDVEDVLPVVASPEYRAWKRAYWIWRSENLGG